MSVLFNMMAGFLRDNIIKVINLKKFSSFLFQLCNKLYSLAKGEQRR